MTYNNEIVSNYKEKKYDQKKKKQQQSFVYLWEPLISRFNWSFNGKNKKKKKQSAQ